MYKYLLLLTSIALVLTSCEEEPPQMIMEEVCEMPQNLINPNPSGTAGFIWYHPGAGLYTIEYGEEGFELGTGISVTSESRSLEGIPMEPDQSYDFYVKAQCEADLGESGFAGPLTYYSEFGQFQCNTVPSDFEVTIVSDVVFNPLPDTVRSTFISWEGNGEQEFQYNVELPGVSPDDIPTDTVQVPFALIRNLQHESVYDFYVRSVCLSGVVTEWVGPFPFVYIGD